MLKVSRPRDARWLGSWFVLIFALGTAGCTQQVIETIPTQYAADKRVAGSTNCNSTLGGYFLPKTFLQLTVYQMTTGKKEYVLKDLNTNVHADNRLHFCLDYLASSFSNDQVYVKRSSEKNTGQFLQMVSSKAFDQTSYIVRRLIRAVFIGIGLGFRSYNADDLKTAELVRNLSFDPFDISAIAVMNESLRAFGFCVLVEGYTIGQQVSGESYCRNPTAYVPQFKSFADRYAAYEAAEVPKNAAGLLYRPLVSYNLLVYSKQDPKGQERWRLRKIHTFNANNLSPLLALRVDRAIFAKKKIAFQFVDGTLQHVCIAKTSELNEGIQIPLEVVKSIVRLPTEIFQIQYDQIADSQQLLEAERKLLTAQQEELEVLEGLKTASNIGRPVPVAAPTRLTYTLANAGEPYVSDEISTIGAKTCTPFQ